MALVDDVKKVLRMQEKAVEIRLTADRVTAWADQYDDVAKSLIDGLNDGTYTPEVAAKKAEEYSRQIDENWAVDVPPKPMEQPPGRRTRGPDRAPRKRVGSVSEPRGPSPEQIRLASEKLAFHLKDAPMTLVGLSAVTGWEEREIEHYLTNDPERFAGWTGRREGDAGSVELWGTREQFYAYASAALKLHESSDRPSPLSVTIVTSALKCGAATAAWAIDRARAEAASDQ
jgi:hypothetical protein